MGYYKQKKFFYQKNDKFEHPALWAYHLEKVKEMIFDSIKKSSSGLIKNYANTPQLRNKYPYHNNYRSITNVNSMSLLKNIKNKILNIEKINPQFISTGNIGCITQITKGTKIPILHTVEIIDWYTGGPKPKVLQKI